MVDQHDMHGRMRLFVYTMIIHVGSIFCLYKTSHMAVVHCTCDSVFPHTALATCLNYAFNNVLAQSCIIMYLRFVHIVILFPARTASAPTVCV